MKSNFTFNSSDQVILNLFAKNPPGDGRLLHEVGRSGAIYMTLFPIFISALLFKDFTDHPISIVWLFIILAFATASSLGLYYFFRRKERQKNVTALQIVIANTTQGSIVPDSVRQAIGSGEGIKEKAHTFLDKLEAASLSMFTSEENIESVDELFDNVIEFKDGVCVTSQVKVSRELVAKYYTHPLLAELQKLIVEIGDIKALEKELEMEDAARSDNTVELKIISDVNEDKDDTEEKKDQNGNKNEIEEKKDQNGSKNETEEKKDHENV